MTLKWKAFSGLAFVISTYLIYFITAIANYGYSSGTKGVFATIDKWFEDPSGIIIAAAIIILPLILTYYSGIHEAAKSKKIAEIEVDLQKKYESEMDRLQQYEAELNERRANVEAEVTAKLTDARQQLAQERANVSHKEANVGKLVDRLLRDERQKIAQQEAALAQREAQVQAREVRADKCSAHFKHQIAETKRWQELCLKKNNQIKGAANLLGEHGQDPAAVGQALSILGGRPKKRRKKPTPESTDGDVAF